MTDTSRSSETYHEFLEANATWSARYIDPSGFECILSIQAQTGVEALKKAESAITHLVDAKCIPVHKSNKNGNAKNNGKFSGSTVLVKTNGNGRNPVCPIHGIEMQKWSKNGRTWYSHRWDDGWCNGKQQ